MRNKWGELIIEREEKVRESEELKKEPGRSEVGAQK